MAITSNLTRERLPQAGRRRTASPTTTASARLPCVPLTANRVRFRMNLKPV
jgi:hypothetical protein